MPDLAPRPRPAFRRPHGTRSVAAVNATRRVESIDVLRGIVMILMALDHVRDYFGDAAADPTNLATASAPLFLTRWVTHFCAPVFFLLTGTGAYLSSRRRDPPALSRFLVVRGLWLIVLDVVILRCLGWQFNFDFRVTFLLVLWALGWSMIVLALLVRAGPAAAAVFGLALVLGHNLFDGVAAASLGPAAPIWLLLHQPGFLVAGPERWVLVAYPLVPWIGVMAAGYAFGRLYELDAQRRRRLLVIIGGVATALFIILRAINSYGDPSEWATQKNAVFTFLSFLNTTKYPPSLLFLLMTLGPSLLALAAFENGTGRGRVREFFVTFGRVPLFFYLLQWPTAHIISVVLHLAFGKPVARLFQTPIDWTGPVPDMGFNLAVVYACWIGGVLLLYPLCKWFAGVKQRRKDWWLSYL